MGGNGQDAAFSIAVDDVGRFTIAGATASSTGFPVSIDAFQPSRSGGADAFVTRLGANGTIEYSTLLGGSSAGTSENAKVALDNAGNFLVTGFTDSTDFPAGTSSTPFQGAKASGSDVFVAKLNPALAPAQQLTARTFVGGSLPVDLTVPTGSRGDFGISVAQDTSGNVYVIGFTSSADFPMANATDSTHGGVYDAFVLKLDPSLSTLLFSTFLGGEADDRGYAIAVDPTNAIHVLGRTSSAGPFTPVAGGGGAPLGPARNGTVDAFIVRYADSTPPTAASLAPTAGPTTGGTPFTIAGTGFQTGATVTFGGAQASSVQVTSTTVKGLTPAGSLGNAPVVVTNPNGASVAVTGGFTYVTPGLPPTVSSIAPTSGSVAGGRSVTITGTNFVNSPLTRVLFDLWRRRA